MDKPRRNSARNSSVVTASLFLAVAGLALCLIGLTGSAIRVSASDPPPLPQPDQTVVSTEEATAVPTDVPTEVPSQVPSEVPTQAVTSTSVPTTVPTSLPSSTSQPLTVVTPTATQAVAATQQVQTQAGATQAVAGVQALPRTGAGERTGGTNWLLAAAGLAIFLAGSAGFALARRRGD